LGLPFELEPMFGQGLPVVEPDFWAGGGFVVVVVEVDGVVGWVLAATVVAVLCVVGDADALAMPAAAPPVASAPATIVAPSILEIVIGSNLLGSIGGCASHRAGRR
jgi:hypothetical protein